MKHRFAFLVILLSLLLLLYVACGDDDDDNDSDDNDSDDDADDDSTDDDDDDIVDDDDIIDDDDTTPTDDDNDTDDDIIDDDDDDTMEDYDVSGWVGGFDIYGGINNIRVVLDGEADNDHETYTNTDGDWGFTGLPQDDYKISFKGFLKGYINHEAGKLIVNALKESQGKLSGLEVKLFPNDIQDYLKCTMWGDGGGACLGESPVEKWTQKPQFKIYTLEYQSGNPVDLNKINLVRSVIKNQLNEFVQGKYIFTDSDIETINEISPTGFEEGKIKIYWDNNLGGGANVCVINEYDIKKCGAGFNTSKGETTMLQELSETLVNGAETQDSAYLDSAFHDPSSTTQYSEEDLMFAAATYGIFSRALGNEHPDNNPLENIFNP